MIVLGAIIGFTHYLPFADLPALDWIEITLISSIMGIYGKKEIKKIIREYAKSILLLRAFVQPDIIWQIY